MHVMLLAHRHRPIFYFFFFFNDTATTEIYPLSLHDALPIWRRHGRRRAMSGVDPARGGDRCHERRDAREGCCTCHGTDRKSTRLNSSHSQISYAVFCLKKKKKTYLESHIFRRCQPETYSIPI